MNDKIITCIHLQADDTSKPSGKNRLSYEILDFDEHCIGQLQSWANEVNNKFVNLKVWVTATLQQNEYDEDSQTNI